MAFLFVGPFIRVFFRGGRLLGNSKVVPQRHNYVSKLPPAQRSTDAVIFSSRPMQLIDHNQVNGLVGDGDGTIMQVERARARARHGVLL